MNQLLQKHKKNGMQRLFAFLFLLLSSGSLMAQCPTGISGAPSGVACSPTPSYSLSGGDATSTWNLKENGVVTSTGSGATFTVPSITGNNIVVEIELITSGCGQQTAGFNVRSANFSYAAFPGWYDVEFIENNSTVTWSGPGTNWNDGGNHNVFSGFCQDGSGTVTMTTADGCTATGSVNYTGLNVSLSGPSSVSCAGTASYSPSLAGTNESYSVSPSGAGSMSGGTFTAAPGYSGSATITYSADYIVTTSKGPSPSFNCSSSTTVTVNCATCNLALSPSSTNVSCNGGSNGSASVSASGANGTVTYSWSNGGSSSSISGLVAGTYVCTATDGGMSGCTSSVSVTISEPSSSVSASCSSTDVTTAGGSDGSASVSVSGGTTPYAYSWSNGGNSASISGLTAGTYSVVVTDANGCSAACTTTITQPTLTCNLSLSPNSTDVSCNGGSNGSASVSASGANGSVSYSWSNGGNSSSISGLSAGTYVCTATDGGMSGCTSSVSITINQPSSAVSVSCSSTNVSTPGGSNGTASVSANGGTPGYSYSWSNGGNTSSISGLSAGNYSVVVTDNNGCSANCNVTITAPSCNLTISATLVDVNCNGGNDGEASITPSGFTGSVQYSWSNGASGSSVSGLSAGSYNVTATDGAGCTSNISFSINQPSSSVSASCSSTNVTTPGGSNGTASVSASGGTPGYSYQWSNGGNTSSISGLSAGNYSVIVYDANGCSATCNTSVTAPGCSLSLSPSQINILCNGGNTGSASVSPSGASGSVSYAWSNGGNTSSISNLSAGTYNVTATDGAGCTSSAGITISEPSSLVSATCSSTNVTTPGGSNGTASVSASGGTPGYSYQWSNGGNTSTISGLSAGNYSVIVYDANGCSTTCNTTVTAPGCTLSLTPSQTNILCNGGSTGSASVSPIGASGSVSYAWSNGGNTSTISNLSAGTYNVTATDGAGCTASIGITITQPTSALTVSCSATNVTSTGGSDGTASVSVSGGTPSYSYAWSNGGTGATISNLVAGNYSVQVTDNNGCSAICNSTVNQPGCNINASVTNLVCNNMGTTSITDDRYSFDLTVTNPTSTVGNYTSNNALISGANYGIVKNITNQFLISSGTLTFVVTDGAVSTCNQTVTVNPPAACSATCNLTAVINSVTNVNSTTVGISFTISGSNGGAWSTSQKLDPNGLSELPLLSGVGDGTYYTTAPALSYNASFGTGGDGFVFWYMLDGYTDCLGDIWVFLPKACLGNYVWNDINKDGIQNNTEVGVAGVTITLYDNTNAIIGSTLTDAYGYYQFCSLVPSTYHIGVTLPINYKFTTSNTTNDLLDSDVDSLTGLSGSYVIVRGDSNMTVDAGIYYEEPTTASVGNYVWFDVDHDGVQDANEQGISGVTVILYNSSNQAVATMLTNSQGYYLFTNVTPGNYSVKFIAPVGLLFSPNNGSIDGVLNSDVNINTGYTTIFTVNAGDKITYVDAGLYTQPINKGGLGDRVWYDQNQDGVQDPTETGVANVMVTLYQADGATIIKTTSTDAYGTYIFNDLAQGQYVVGFTNLPSGYILTSTTGTDSTTNSDANVTTAKTPIINLAAGQYNMTYDAGIYTNIPANNNSIGNYVWDDANKDGIQDITEQGVSGVTVTLYDNTNTVISSTSTDANGMYLFPDLPNGTYHVGFSNLPLAYVFSNRGNGTTATDTDPDGSTGLSGNVVLTGNTHNMTIDAGINLGGRFSGLGTLGNYVWYDMNNNGLQDVNESGVAGVVATLYYGDGTTVISTTTTDALGNYIFTGLRDTSYVVGFSNLPSGYSISPKDADVLGINGEENSDVNSVSRKTDAVYLGAGEDNMNLDMGIVPPTGTASLGNFVWFDLNNDGLQTVGEPGVQGVSVTLYNYLDQIVKTTTTDVNGEYYFVGLSPAVYSVGFSNLPEGYSFTTKDANTLGINNAINSDADAITGVTATVTLLSGDNNLNLDAGIKSTTVASVGDYVWYDLNHDGIQDANEPGLGGILVTLYNSSNTQVASAITKPDGSYIFTNVTPGDYTMGFSNIPTSLEFTIQETNTSSNTGSNVNPSTGFTPSFTVLPGTHNPTIDAGLSTPLVTGLGNYVWFDADEDGLQDASETPVAGAIVTLYAQNGTTVLATAVTNGNGAYSFTNLNAGTYIVGFSNFPAGYYKTRSVGTLNDVANSDLGAFNRTAPITLALGTYNPNIDAGIMFGFPLNAKELKATTAIINNKTYECSVNWYTVEEINTQSFTIERSINGVDFEAVGTVQANGSTNGQRNYNFNDNVASVKDIAVIYYRIQLIDIDGKQTMSNIINTRPVNTDGDITIYPVPFTSQVLVAYSSESVSTINISISDLSGRTISTTEKEVAIGNNTIEINGLSNLPSGTYFVTIVDDYNGNKYIRKINK